jgi:hypothetical protein
MTPDGLLSIRAYAKHRGVSDTAVRKALKKGKIVAEPDGRIDAEKADAAWEDNTREPKGGIAPGSQDGSQVRTSFHDALARAIEDAAESIESKAEAERRKEVALANIREREDAIGAGRVVDRQATAQAWFAVCRRARDQFMAVRERVEVRLGLSTEQLDILTAEMRSVLHELTKEVPGLGDSLPEHTHVLVEVMHDHGPNGR